MYKIIKTSIIIYDDYNNILAIQKDKNKDTSNEIWSLIGKELKGKENEEKCIIKAVDKDLGCTIFNLTPFKEYAINEESDEGILVYSGIIRGQMTCHKSINKVKWISKGEIDTYTFSTKEKEMLLDFFKNHVK